jgi:hypothetical protein
VAVKAAMPPVSRVRRDRDGVGSWSPTVTSLGWMPG